MPCQKAQGELCCAGSCGRRKLQFSEFALHPDSVHLQLALAVDDEPAVDAQLLDGKQRVVGGHFVVVVSLVWLK